MQRFFQGAMDTAAGTGVGPNQYSDAGGTQLLAAPYDFPGEYIAIDQQLEASELSQSNHARDQDNPTSASHMAAPTQNGNGHATQTNTAQDTRSSTTTQPNTPLNPATKRKSFEDTTETSHNTSDSKRKRSKVSRACDQCRRKKIRCDADSEGSGQLKTCTNCQKAGQICEYSRIPQKRGPSKGYIKELSERVQQVEGQLALQRSSFDSQIGGYADSPYSPEDETALRNRTSFSQQRNPFADFTRDRFPSVSGSWHNNSITSAPRQSIAIPPDQLVSPQEKPKSSSSARVFWSEWIESPSKRRKLSAEATELTESDKMIFTQYYDTIHLLCPILPDAGSNQTFEIIALASKEYQEAIVRSVKLLPQTARPTDTAPADSSETLELTADRESLEKFIHEKAREPFSTRSDVDSLVLLWTELLFLVVVMHDLKSWSKPNLPECDLIRMALDVCADHLRARPYTPDLYADSAWSRSSHIAAMLARLYAISHGESNDPVPASLATHLSNNSRVLPPRIAFVTMMTDSLQAALSLLPQPDEIIPPNAALQISRMQNANIRAWLSATGLPPDDPIVAEIRYFADLLSLRCATIQFAKPAITGPVANLVEAIRLCTAAQAEAANDKYIFSPLSLHTNTLATITLLELQKCNFDDDQLSASLTEESTKTMKKVLSQLVERRETLSTERGGIFWATTLLDMIKHVTLSNSANRGSSIEKNEDDLVVDMAALLQRGYATVLLDFHTSRSKS